jgi:hypothetical protein
MTQPITITTEIKQQPEDIPNTITHLQNSFGHPNLTIGKNPLTNWTQLHITIKPPNQPNEEDLTNAMKTVFEYLDSPEIDVHAISASCHPIR